MKSLHRATTSKTKAVGSPKTSGGGSLKLRHILIIVTLVGLSVFVGTQFINKEGGDGGASGKGKKHQNEKHFHVADAAEEPPARVIVGGGGEAKKNKIIGENPYEKVKLATIDGDVANREHADNVALAEQHNNNQNMNNNNNELNALEAKLEKIHDKDGEVAKALLGGGEAGRGLKCPTFDLEAFDRELQIPLKHLPRKKKTSVSQKYDRRAHNCAGDGIWNRVTIKDHHAILQNIARLAKIRPGTFVFDWGCGCGHQLEFLTKEFGCTGVGIDVSSKTVAYAAANTSKVNLHCVADGTKLEWIPSNNFDHAYSFGSIYHVYNRSKFCHVLRQMVRIVKPGGTVYNGWTENAEYRRGHVGMCLADLPVRFTIFEEALEFKHVQIFPLKGGQTSPNTYSLVISKLNKYPNPSLYDGLAKYSFKALPIECGIHKCEPKDGVVLFSPLAAGAAPAEGVAAGAAVAADGAGPVVMAKKQQEHAEEVPVAADAGDSKKKKKGDVVEAEGQDDANKEVEGGGQSVWSFEGWPTCPVYDRRMEELQIPLEHLPRKKKTSVSQKYDRRAHNCATTGVWHKISLEDHKAILNTIGKTIEAKKDELVFDWGCGCGHQLEFMFNTFGARGLGIDVSNLTIAYAINSTVPANRFCVADGTRLDWIPDNFFDKAFSFGSIYHVYDKKLFCSVLRQMVRIVKPGGLVYNGWTENAEFHRDHVVKCVNTADDSWMPEKDRLAYAEKEMRGAEGTAPPPNLVAVGGDDGKPFSPKGKVTFKADRLVVDAKVDDDKDLGEKNDEQQQKHDEGEGGDNSGRKLQAVVGDVDPDAGGADAAGDGAGSDHIVEILPEKDLFAAVDVFPLKARQTARNTYSILIRKSKRS